MIRVWILLVTTIVIWTPIGVIAWKDNHKPPVRSGSEIQTLIDEAVARGSHEVRIPKGAYVVSELIRIPSGMAVYGNMSTILEPEDCRMAAFTNADKDAHDITLNGFNFPARDERLPTEVCGLRMRGYGGR